MSKGIAIRTILLLLIGVLVAGVLSYMIYGQITGSVISEAECHVRLSELCALCENTGWPDNWPKAGSSFFELLSDCCSNYGRFSSFCEKSNCAELNNPCMAFGFQTTTTTTT